MDPVGIPSRVVGWAYSSTELGGTRTVRRSKVRQMGGQKEKEQDGYLLLIPMFSSRAPHHPHAHPRLPANLHM